MKKKGKNFMIYISLFTMFLLILWLGIYFLSNHEPSPVYGHLDSKVSAKQFNLKTLNISWNKSDNGVLEISRTSNNKTIYKSIGNESFVQAAEINFSAIEHRGSFDIEDELTEAFSEQVVDSVYLTNDVVQISGKLLSQEGNSVTYKLLLSEPDSGRLHIELSIPEKKINRTFLKLQSGENEKYFGLGTQFTHFQLNGYRVPVFITEQGIGRGKQPITFLVNMVAKAGGNEFTSYAAVPHFTSSHLRSVYLENYEYSVFDFRNEDAVQVSVNSNTLKANILDADTPKQLIEAYTHWSGKMRKLPDWIIQGAVIGMQGGTKKISEILYELKSKNMPISALWLQDWVGQRTTSFGKQLWWNWQLDKNHYSGWPIFKTELDEANIKLLTYINPFLTDASENPNHPINLINEAADKNFLVKDKNGNDLMLLNTDFSAGMLDLTNPGTHAWAKSIIKENLINQGSNGWMADFGEALPLDASIYDGTTTAEHNRYPERWAQINREAIDEADTTNSHVFFMRAAFARSPKYATLFWLGDQNTSWDEYDGIKTAVTGLLSSGLSGFAYNHSDIGGYTAITRWPLNMKRSKELFLRWCELNAFTTIYRTHEGNRPDENYQFYNDSAGMEHFIYFGKLYAALFEYRKKLVEEASLTGMPVVRHLFLHYPTDVNTYNLSYQEFMLGEDLIIAPVTDPNTSEVEVYLPAGNWIHVYTGKEFNQTTGSFTKVAVPIGQPAVFAKANSEVLKTLQTFIKNNTYNL